MRNEINSVKSIRAIVRVVVIVLIVVEFGFNVSTRADSLYIGDLIDDTVKAFDALTGEFQGLFVKKEAKGKIRDPQGLIFNPEGNLLLANQNEGTQKAGEIRKHDGATGAFLGALVSHSDKNAPFVPRGIVLLKGIVPEKDVLFVADITVKGKNAPPGRLLEYTGQGVFLADLTPDHDTFPGTKSQDEFHARGLVVGPDGLLYVSVCDDLDPTSADFNPLPGWILRFDPKTGAFVDVIASYNNLYPTAVTCADLHRPDGLAFGPDGRLYVTAFRANGSDTDKILIVAPPPPTHPQNGKWTFIGKIDLDQVDNDPDHDQPRAFAQALLFGPGGSLFVPIAGNGPDTGSVRQYDAVTKKYTIFVPASGNGGALGVPEYLTFGNTDPATLAYQSQ